MAAQFIPEGAYPWGNEGYREPVRAPAGVAVPTLPITEDQESEVPFVDLGSRRRLIHLGADLSSTQATAFLNPIPSGADTQQPFSVSQGDIETTEPGTRRFTVGLQGGYAGGRIYKNPLFRADVTADNQQGLDCSSFDSPGTDAYRSALLLLEDRISTRVSHVSLPGCLLSIHQAVLQEAESLCERRNDCLLTAQVAGPGTSTTDIERISGSLDGSQVALYHGWVRTGLGPAPVQDLVPQVFSLNDRLGSVATAPAGRTRGRLSPSALGLYEVYSRADRERLLSSDVNHPSRNRDRLFIVGQETRYDDRSALSHVNVRRGTNFAKLVALDAASDALFEPNTPDTVDEVEGRITDALNAVSVRGGLEGFRVSFSGEGQEITGSIALSFQDVIEEVVVDFSVLRDRIVFA
jgi:hypothetical protein